VFILYDHHEAIHRLICSRTRKAFLTGWMVFLPAMAALVILFLRTGAPAMNGEAWDTTSPMDGAWRLLHGQVPHKDYYYYSGDLPSYVTLLGMKLGYPGITSITIGNLFVLLAAGISAMVLLARRTSAFYAVVFSLFIVFLAVTPRALGDAFDYTSYAMMYNRYGEAVLALLGVALFVPPESGAKQSGGEWVETIFCGLCLTVLLFCKLNYFAVGAGWFVLACLRRRFSIGQTLTTALTAAFFLYLAFHLTRIPASAMRSDYAIMAAGQSLRDRLQPLAVQAGKGVVPLLFLLALAWEVSNKEPRPRQICRIFFLMAFIFGSEVLLVASNAQRGELPLLAVAALYGVETIRRQSGADSSEHGPFVAVRNFGAMLLLLFFMLPTLGADFKTMRFVARRSKAGEYFAPAQLQSTPLKDFRFVTYGTRYAEMKNYAANMDEGVALLRRHTDSQMRLAVFLFSNPYHVALGLPPQEGGVICWSWTGFTKRSHPPLQRMVGNANYVLTGAGPDLADGLGAIIRPNYGTEWDDLHLQVVEQTEHFTLFKVPQGSEH
jgi:hypothetical protein